jgi:hypothetical protein
MNNNELLNMSAKIKEFTLDLAQTAATYDVCSASGDVLITGFTGYVSTSGGTLTSVEITTNDTTDFEFFTSTEAQLSALTQQRTLTSAKKAYKATLHDGKKIQYIISGGGAANCGEIKFIVEYYTLTKNAHLVDLT